MSKFAQALAVSTVTVADQIAAVFARDEIIVTGIGSRETPDDILSLMTRIGAALEARKARLRSGGAGGADLAFEAGWTDASLCEIYHPWHGFKPKVGGTDVDVERILGRKRPKFGAGAPIVISGDVEARAMEIASASHPAWERCGHGARKLHTRNVPQVLGADLGRLTDMVICWTVDGGPTGGTGQAIRMAMQRGVLIVNLQRTDHRAAIMAALGL